MGAGNADPRRAMVNLSAMESSPESQGRCEKRKQQLEPPPHTHTPPCPWGFFVSPEVCSGLSHHLDVVHCLLKRRHLCLTAHPPPTSRLSGTSPVLCVSSPLCLPLPQPRSLLPALQTAFIEFCSVCSSFLLYVCVHMHTCACVCVNAHACLCMEKPGTNS